MLRRLALIRDIAEADDLARHGSIMVVFAFIALFFSYLYQLSMAMMLPSGQYGTLLSLLSLFLIISIFSQTISTSIAKFTSRFNVQNKLGGINYLWRFSLKRTFLLGSVMFLALALFTPLLSGFLSIDNNWYCIVLFSSFILAFMVAANLGVLQGLQRFLPLGFSNALLSFLRLSIGVLLVYLGFGLYGGLLCIPIAILVVVIVTLSFLRDLAGAGNEKVDVSGLFSYTGLAFLAIASFAMLTNIDVVLAKHYLSPDIAGNYAAISVMGRIALYAPMGIAIAMFPKTSQLFETGSSHRPLLRKAVFFTLLLAGGVIIIYWLFPEFIVNFLFGAKYPLASLYLLKYGLAMGFFALSALLLNYFLSLNQTKVAYALIAAMLLELGLIAFFHASIAQIVDVMFISGALCLLFMLPFYLKVRRRETGL